MDRASCQVSRDGVGEIDLQGGVGPPLVWDDHSPIYVFIGSVMVGFLPATLGLHHLGSSHQLCAILLFGVARVHVHVGVL